MKLEILCVSILVMLGSLLLAFIVLILKNKTKTPEIRTLGFLFLSIALYCFGYMFELLTVSVGDKLLFNHIQYLGLPFIAPIWFLMCLQFCKRQKRVSWKLTVLLFLIPVVTMILNLTHTTNGLFYSSFQMVQTNSISVLVFTKGIWYYVESAYKLVLLTLSVWMYAKELIGSSGMSKKQSGYLLLLSIIGMALAASSMITATTAVIDIVCVLLSIPFVLISVTIFKHELFNLIPQAYSTLFDVLDQPILILSNSKKVVRANAEAKRVFAYSLAEGRQPRLEELFDGEEPADKPDQYLYYKIQKDRSRFYTVRLIGLDSRQTENGKGYLAVLTDTTSHVEEVRSLKTLADVDPLTGLYNRRHFFSTSGKTLVEARETGCSVSLLIFDIDHFKSINDAYGHQAGDSVLKSVSNTISHQLRNEDMLARFGGDEFVLMLGMTNTNESEMVAQRICKTVRDTRYMFDGHRIPITLSVGIGGGQSSEFNDMNELMSLADAALYDAKSTGRNKVCINGQCSVAQ